MGISLSLESYFWSRALAADGMQMSENIPSGDRFTAENRSPYLFKTLRFSAAWLSRSRSIELIFLKAGQC
jgi:hypothetical protein